MSERSSSTTVIGAGVAGLTVALYLQRSGHRVTVLDPFPSPGGASYGNAGLISADTAVPIALPGMLRKVPGWLLDPVGPLSLRPRYFPRALPWLARWIDAGRLRRVVAISDAMRSLHRDSFDCWRELLGNALFDELIRPVGQMRIWEGDAEVAQIELDLCQRHGVKVEMLGRSELLSLYPGLAPGIHKGMLMPGNGYTVSPVRLMRTLSDLLHQAGAEFVAERALKIIPDGARGYRVMTNLAHRSARRLVIASGAWARELLDPLGIRVPLETERGYHAVMPSANVQLPIPISVKNRGFALTSMEDGLRAAGTVEIAGLYFPPEEKRAEILVDHVKRIFPGLECEEPQLWMGHRPSTPDSLPILGEAPRNPGLYLALGHGHFGLTSGPPGGRLVARLVNGQPTGIDGAPYAPDRFHGV